ncbi:hypothetical protein OIE66_26680 [Nonomuraea sp. NBC_01738]|uniref:hypothetical protein n=1 Tax=Nonomuraea sp. NBC_01738 TaxID=2976003 RepID=UPI002E10A6D2|nr:hypothetical protein OIE66_26680 [Nonomuraea sp. NBC_01738]
MREHSAAEPVILPPADLAGRLAALVAGELLGIPEADRPAFTMWLEEQAQALVEGYLAELVETRVHRPGDDVLSTLLRAGLPETQVLAVGQAVLGTAYAQVRAAALLALSGACRT